MGSFISELRRRKVLRVAAAYIVSSWVLLQVAELLASVLELSAGSAAQAAMTARTSRGACATGTPAPQPGNTALIVVSAVFVIAALAAGGIWYSGKDARWARNVAMSQIEAFVGDDDLEGA